MQVRGPVAIFRIRSDGGKGLPFFQVLALAQARPLQAAEVAVEAVESGAFQFVLQNNGDAVVAEIGVVGQAVHAGRQRRQHRRAGRQPHVHPQVQGPGFFHLAGPKVLAAAVNNPVFEVSAHANTGALFGQHGVHDALKRRRVAQVGVANCRVVIG